MYSLACINLSSEAHLSDALGSSQYPVLKVPKGPCPTLAPRCGARKNYTSIPHAVSRKIFKKFFRPVAEGWYGGDDHKHNHHSLLSVPPSVFSARRQTAMQRQETPLEKKPYYYLVSKIQSPRCETYASNNARKQKVLPLNRKAGSFPNLPDSSWWSIGDSNP